jgi:biotin operon repressor
MPKEFNYIGRVHIGALRIFDISCVELVVLERITSLSKGIDKCCWLSNASLASDVGITEASLQRMISKLRNLGLIEVGVKRSCYGSLRKRPSGAWKEYLNSWEAYWNKPGGAVVELTPVSEDKQSNKFISNKDIRNK